MTPESARQVQRSFQHVVPHGDELVEAVFPRLAEAEPRLAPLFPADSAPHRRRFLIGLAFAVDGLDDVDQMIHGLCALGAACRHAGIGDGEVAAIRKALLDTFAQALGGQARGSRWTVELEATWLEAAVCLGEAILQQAAQGRAAA